MTKATTFILNKILLLARRAQFYSRGFQARAKGGILVMGVPHAYFTFLSNTAVRSLPLRGKSRTRVKGEIGSLFTL